MEYEVIISQKEDGYLVEVPALPGCVSQGKTEEEALLKIRELIPCYLQTLRASSEMASSWQVRKIEVEENLGANGALPASEVDPILRLSGLGKEIWQGIDPDEYVRRERGAWGWQ